MDHKPQTRLGNLQTIREWLSVLAILLSLGGLILNFVLQPQSDISDIRSRVNLLEKDVKQNEKDIDWLKQDINTQLQRIWSRVR